MNLGSWWLRRKCSHRWRFTPTCCAKTCF